MSLRRTTPTPTPPTPPPRGQIEELLSFTRLQFERGGLSIGARKKRDKDGKLVDSNSQPMGEDPLQSESDDEVEAEAEEGQGEASGAGVMDVEEEAQQEEAQERDPRGPDPPLPEAGKPRVVGRGSELADDGVAVVHDYLVHWPRRTRPKRKERYEWKTEQEMRDGGDLQAAFDLLPPERRGEDPTGKHWIVSIDDVKGPASARVFRTIFFTWRPNVAKRRVWQPYARFIDKSVPDAFVAQQTAAAGLGDDDSEDEAAETPGAAGAAGDDESADREASQSGGRGGPGWTADTQLSQVPGGPGGPPDRTADAPSSLRWDPSSGRARLSLRAAVRNHAGDQPWTLSMLKEYTLTRRFVTYSRMPPATEAEGGPTEEEADTVAEDLFRIREKRLRAQFVRSRAAAVRRRAAEAEDEDEDEDEDEVDSLLGDDADEGEDEDEDEDDELDDATAEQRWKDRTLRQLRDSTLSRWGATREALKQDLEELDHQWRALGLIDAAEKSAAATSTAVDRAGVVTAAEGGEDARVKALLEAWRDGADDGAWTREFARPRLKLPDVRDYLSARRSEDAAGWLRLQREEHHEASRTSRTTGVMGSSLSSEWQFDSVPTATQAPGEHTCPVDWFTPNTDTILETRQAEQNPAQITIALLSENSAKGSLPLGTFSLPDEAKGDGVYTPALGARSPKRSLLARATVMPFLCYPGMSNKKSSKGKAAFATSSGIAVLGRAFDYNSATFRRLVEQTPTAWERRIQLLCLALPQWQVGNPLTLYNNVLTDEFWALAGARMKGNDVLLKLCDEALGNSVLYAPV